MNDRLVFIFSVILGYVAFAIGGNTIEPQSIQESPRETVQRFVKLDYDGKLSDVPIGPDLTGLFVGPPISSSQQGPWTISVIKDYVLSDVAIHEDMAEMYVEYLEWGQIDSSARFDRHAEIRGGRPFPVRMYLNLVFTDKTWRLGPTGSSPIEAAGTSAWRIKRPDPVSPHMSVDAAIRYLTRLRDNTADRRIAANAGQTISALRHLP